ncbi:lipopolysaccharide biosynthesis protein [Opitutaceae bacterium]|nr:lipopolysaccharide biosynthesis protein [Opitutaceae bacterium]
MEASLLLRASFDSIPHVRRTPNSSTYSYSMNGDNESGSGHLLERAAQGYRTTIVTQVVRVVCKLVSVVVMARLVAPVGFGDFAMAAAVFGILALFRDAGLGTAAIQAKNLTPAQMNGLFWAHLGMGSLMAAATWGLAPLAASWFRSESVTALLHTMSIAFLIIGAGGFARSQLYREMRLTQANRLESISAVTGTIAMVGAAIGGAEAYAFVVFLIVSELLATVLAWLEIAWRPNGGWKGAGLGPLWRVGRHVTLNQLVSFFSTQLDAILIGRWFGAGAVGLYTRSSQLLTLPRLYIAGPLNQIMLTTLARLKNNPVAMTEHASKAVTSVSHLVLPFYLICIILPDPTIRVLLGSDWLEAAPLLQVLAAGRAVNTLTSMAETMNIALERTNRLAGAAAMSLVATALAIFIGRNFGLVGIAWAVSIAQIVTTAPRLWWLLRDVPGSLGRYLRAIRGPLILSMITMTGLAGGAILLENTAAWIQLIGALLAGIFANSITFAVSQSIRGELLATFKLVSGRYQINPNASTS